MTIFFYQVAIAFFPLFLIISFIEHKKHIINILVPAAFGIFVGFFIFTLFKISMNTDNGKIFFDAFLIFLLLISPLALKFSQSYFANIFSFFLGLSYAFDYGVISMNFPIFAGDLLDSLSLSNLFMVCFGFALLILSYFAIKCIFVNFCRFIKNSFFIIILIVLLIDRASFLTLNLMHNGFIPSYTKLLSIIAKSIYFSTFLPITLSVILVVMATLTLSVLPGKISSKNIVEFRKNKAKRNFIFKTLAFSVVLGGIFSFFSLYYLLVASQPPKITTPTLIEPVNGEFKFDANIVLDGELHRFAYIMDDGHEVRFFLLNRFTDKLVPVAVFDACAICGDMGYIKKGDNLICISCNVRIFLPSVGKAGGCNPIPLEYTFDGQYLTISLETIESGATFFSKIVKKEVIDPVSRNKIMNDSKFTYLYYGRTYFFENEKNQMEFEENAEKYVTTKGVLKELR